MEQVRGNERPAGVAMFDTALAAIGLAAAGWGIYGTVTADRAGEMLGSALLPLAVCVGVVLVKALRFGGIPHWSPTPYALLWTAVALATLLLMIMLPGKFIQFAVAAIRT